MKFYIFDVRDDEREPLESFQKRGYDLALTGDSLTLESIDRAEGYDGVSILGQKKIDLPLLTRMKELSIPFLSTRTIGYNHIDTEGAKKAGIKVSNAFYEPHGVAEYTVMFMLLLLRHYKVALWRGQVNDFSLEGLIGRELRSLTVGVVGTGSIGARVVELVHGFGAEVLAYSRRINEELEKIANYVDLDTLYEKSDIISLHLPLTDSTANMVNSESISRMKDSVILINCARGGLMNVPDIIEAVENKKIGALGLDVFDKEEDIYHKNHRTEIIANREMAYLRQFPNVVMTPHMAFYTREAVESMVKSSLESLEEFVKQGKSKRQIV